jgi:hypothetical protein
MTVSLPISKARETPSTTTAGASPLAPLAPLRPGAGSSPKTTGFGRQ